MLQNTENIDPVHTGPDHHINLKSLKTSMTLKFVIILQNLIKAYHRKSDKSKYDRKLTELDVVELMLIILIYRNLQISKARFSVFYNISLLNCAILQISSF